MPLQILKPVASQLQLHLQLCTFQGHTCLPWAVSELIYHLHSLGFACLDHPSPILSASWCMEPVFLPCSYRQLYPSTAFSPKQRHSHLCGKGHGNGDPGCAGAWDLTAAQEERKQPGWVVCMKLSGVLLSQPYPFTSVSFIPEK